MNLTELLAAAGVSIGTAAITSLILQKLSENNIWCHVDTRLTKAQRDVLETEFIVDHLKEEVAEHIMDNSRDCEEIIDILAEQSTRMDYLQRHLEELEYLMRTDEVIGDASPYDDDPEPEFDSMRGD